MLFLNLLNLKKFFKEYFFEGKRGGEYSSKSAQNILKKTTNISNLNKEIDYEKVCNCKAFY